MNPMQEHCVTHKLTDGALCIYTAGIPC